MKEQQNIDNLFKEGLENPDLEYNELDWLAMERKLDGKPRRVIALYWLSGVSAIAAILLVCFFIWKPGENGGRSLIAKKNKTDINKAENALKNSPKAKILENENIQKRKDNLSQANSVKELPSHIDTSNELIGPREDEYERLPDARKLANIDFAKTNLSADYALVLPEVLSVNSNLQVSAKNTKKIVMRNKRPQLSLSIVAAPDLTSVQRSGRSSLSGGLGLEATLAITKRLSITTGATYAKKIYDSDFSLYNPQSSYVFKNQPDNIHANCDVLDIPLNVNYKLMGNGKNTLTITTGLSSYMMLKEKYSYSYQNPYADGPSSYQVSNQNQHFLGVANIAATFQRKINGRLNIGITPFVKIPLTNIGYVNSKLTSTGVAVSVNVQDIFKRK
ncbi:hypothetical protein [Pedobacter agri]|uniref:hypothetical protein n=1 Tax=Pedobacter agri TaxID=454586 RepID=UPI0029313A15|nr:hypothetical protein [Pedobacter agri]